MTRFTHLFFALALTGALAGATIAACGSHPGSPGEMAPLAPRPDPGMPGEPGSKPSQLAPSSKLEPTLVPADAGTGLAPGPVSSVAPPPSGARVIAVPTPAFSPVTGGGAQDAGTSDSYAPPLPPIPDGGVTADSRLEPR